MVWNSRAEKLPPPSFFSLIVAYLQQAYPGARISREMMLTLRPYFVEAWRHGKNAEAAAQTTCSCDGKEIVPSPVVGVHIARGSVRPPKGAQRGEVFGAEALRQPASVERVQKKLQRIAQAEAKQQSVEARWAQRAQTARKDLVRNEAQRKQAVASTRSAALREEAQRLEAEMRRLRTELQRTPRTPRTPAKEPSPPPPVAAESPKAPSKRRAEKPRVPAAAPAPDAQNAAMLRAIQGMLPEVAGQIAAQLAKEGKPS